MNELIGQAFGLKGKVALITGGGSGLGFAIARTLQGAGATVILVGHSNEENLKEACAQLEGSHYYLFDITRLDEVQGFVKQVHKEHGPIDILVNNAGVHCKKNIEDLQPEDFRRVFDVHYLASISLVQAVLPSMRGRRQGKIIFLSSMSAFVGLTKVVAYTAAKGAITASVRALAAEVSCDNIQVNAIAPGFIDTPMFRLATDNDPERKKKILGHTPTGRFGEPLDVGFGALYLASPASDFVTGTCLMIDGGFSIGF
ncbi:MAG TPA: glucose 1-dehydrogenase [Sphaerochaeta sp.]|nr:glucose 1-dehydrogenase [Sphaerochaeta sp.]